MTQFGGEEMIYKSVTRTFVHPRFVYTTEDLNSPISSTKKLLNFTTQKDRLGPPTKKEKRKVLDKKREKKTCARLLLLL